VKITIINTGGTFNKKYNPISGKLEIDCSNESIVSILDNTYGNVEFEIINIISKDSLEFDDNDRKILLQTIRSCDDDIIVIHGTDTMKQSCEYIDKNLKSIHTKIIFTGSMHPYYCGSYEPTFNLATSIAALKFLQKNGIFIAMHGIIDHYSVVEKDRQKGRFYQISSKKEILQNTRESM